MQLHPQEALLQQVRALQQSEALSEYRQRRVVVEHRLARLVQLGIRQSRYFGRIKTRFQLYLAATVANLTLVAAKAGTTGETGHGPSAGSALGRWHGQLRRQYRDRVARANSDPHFARVGITAQIILPNKGFSSEFLGWSLKLQGAELTAGERILITGAAGFAGSRLTEALLNLGYSVTGLDVAAPNHAEALRRQLSHLDFRYLWKSIQDIQPGDVVGHSVVAHLAAQPDTPLAFESPRYTVMQNVAGTVEVLEVVRRAGGVSKVIFAGSGNEVGRPDYIPMDEDHPLTPHNPYGFSKAAGELAMWAWYRAYGVPAVILSTGVVVGPGMRREVFIFKWLWNALHGHPIVVEGGQQTRDVTFIDDVAEAWVRVIQAPPDVVAGQKFYVGCGEEITVEDLAVMCRNTTGAGVPIEYVDYRPGEEGQREAFSTDKARRVLGYSARTSASEAIRLTADWARTLVETPPGEVEPPVPSP